MFDELAELIEIDNKTCHITTEFNKEEFNILCNYFNEMKDSQVLTTSKALAIVSYMFWLKKGKKCILLEKQSTRVYDDFVCILTRINV